MKTAVEWLIEKLTKGDFDQQQNAIKQAMEMEKAFLLSHIYREKHYYKLVYALTLEEAKLKLKYDLDRLYLELYNWKNIEHKIQSQTL